MYRLGDHFVLVSSPQDHRSLTDVIDENLESSLEEVTELYEEYEKGRRERLRLCQEERERIIREGWNSKSSVKPFTALETVLEHKAESLSTDSKAKSPSDPSFTDDRAHSKSAITISDRFTTTHAQRFPYSFSLADLRRSPATERRLKSLSQEISRKLCITIPEKDHKIASLMLAKHEEEQFRLRQSKFEEQNREEERRREEARRARLEQKKRKELLRHIRRWQEDLEERRRRREEQEAALTEQRKRETLQQEERWRRLAEEQQTQRWFKHNVANREAKERKRYQERLRQEKERNEEAQRETESQAAREKEQHAMRSKRTQDKRERRRIKQENERELLKHLLLKKEAEEREHAEKELRRNGLERKLQRSSENHEVQVEARVQEMRLRALKEEGQMRTVQERLERENRDWVEQKQTLVKRCQVRMENAVRQAQEERSRRAQRVRRENQEKEMNHRRLQDRVLEELKARWEQRCEAVTQKDERREKLLKERAEVMERSRKVAHASCYMRDRVREQTSRRSFDQMAREAELNAHVGRLKL
ncbi:coiled-coil domain-containing protein 177 [Pimephales promelas]|uniref:coiled-coil domain-containing protein 177 n=1 Tax=Pimephales promelas TaxID=90988 RepID=UPI001955AB23|nr:coiled-coil domain-containing protein 177 [Pimephales promelas]